jgi:hypothetical protein
MDNNLPTTPAPASPSMSGKTILLIVGLCVLTIALVVLAVKMNKTTPSTQDQASAPTPTPIAHTVLSFSPQTTTVSSASSSAQSLDIMINANGDPVSGIQLELSFDPKVITLKTLTPGTFLPNSLTLLPAKIDNVNGTATLIFAKTPSQKPQNGSGLAASLTYTIKPGVTASQTQIKILPKSEISGTGMKDSVLKSEDTATIMLNSAVKGASTHRILITPGQGV